MRGGWTWIVLPGLAWGACGAEDGPGDGSPMARRETCAATVCELERQDCRERTSRRCDDCFDICAEQAFYDGNAGCFDSCTDLCDSSSCSVGWCDDTCAERRFVFTLPSRSDPAVYESCLRAEQYDRTCGFEVTESGCDRRSRTLRTEVAAAWDCHVALACDQDGSPCYAELPPGTLGDEGCAAVALACGQVCNPAWRDQFNRLSAWWREDVVEALRGCFVEPDCDDLVNCVDAWQDALWGG
jgi:hypothetical protein